MKNYYGIYKEQQITTYINHEMVIVGYDLLKKARNTLFLEIHGARVGGQMLRYMMMLRGLPIPTYCSIMADFAIYP